MDGWIKLYRSILTDEKTRDLSDSEWRIFVSYILLASPSRKYRGMIVDSDNRPLNQRERRELTGRSRSSMSRIERKLLNKELIVRSEEAIKVASYEKYQAKAGVSVSKMGDDANYNVSPMGRVESVMGHDASQMGQVGSVVGQDASAAGHDVSMTGQSEREPDPKSAPKNNKNIKNIKNNKNSDPRIARLVDSYHFKFTEKIGHPPEITGQHGATFARLLRHSSEEQIGAALDYFIGNKTYGWSGWTIGVFSSRFAAILAEAEKRHNDGRPTREEVLAKRY
jgi:hypothetical protein